MSLNQSMNISLGSMKNNQYALTVVSQNIANMHVDGYCRQYVNFATNEYTTNCENVISTIKGMNGASIASLGNYINDGAFNALTGSNSDAQYYNTLADALKGLEDISDDLGDNGLNSLLNSFYKAAANLEQNPADMATRQQYVAAAQNVCDKFNAISKKYDAIEQNTYDLNKTELVGVNTLLSELTQANIAHVKSDGSPATKTQINNILEELSNYVDFSTSINPNGTAKLYIGGTAVVSGGEQKYSVETKVNNDGSYAIYLQSNEDPQYTLDVTSQLKGGSIKARMDVLNGSNSSYTSIKAMKSSLDHAAIAFANKLNKIQNYDQGGVFAASIKTDPATGNLILTQAQKPMFTTTDGENLKAYNITVNSEIVDYPFLISAARIDTSKYAGDEWKYAVGNSDNACEITAVQNENICSYEGDLTNPNCTLSQYLINSANKVGAQTSSANKKAEIYQDIFDADKRNYSNLTGVNLDEELSDMIRYQRAFEASARVFSTVNNLLGTIINMV